MKALLRGMQGDIALGAPPDPEHPSRSIVIDTKVASVTNIGQFGQFGQQTLASGFVYQAYANDVADRS